MQPPAQELVARDLHDNVWTFRHIYRGKQILKSKTLKKNIYIYFLKEIIF